MKECASMPLRVLKRVVPMVNTLEILNTLILSLGDLSMAALFCHFSPSQALKLESIGSHYLSVLFCHFPPSQRRKLGSVSSHYLRLALRLLVTKEYPWSESKQHWFFLKKI
ncbi:hypothetical protein AMTRI_Chr03g141240 [Amborella trichopoda]